MQCILFLDHEDDMECDVIGDSEEGMHAIIIHMLIYDLTDFRKCFLFYVILTEYQSIFNSKVLSTSDRIRFEACKVLVHYSYHYGKFKMVLLDFGFLKMYDYY